MNKICLSDICEISAGQSAPQKKEFFSDDGYPFVRAGSLESLVTGNDKLEHIKANIGEKLRLRLFPKNTILFAKSGMSAKIGRLYILRQPSYVVNHLAAIIPDEKKVNPGWLKRWFEYHPPSRLITNESYPSIKLSDISRLSLAFVPLEEQDRISNFIDTADSIRQKRKEQLTLLDDYLKSVFIDMFGDYFNDESNLIHLEKLTKRISVGHVGPTSFAYVNKGIPFLRTQNVKRNFVDMNQLAYVNEMFHKKLKKSQIQTNDVLISRVGVNRGIAAVVPKELDGANCANIVIVGNSEKFNSIFLSAYLNFTYGRSVKFGYSVGSAQGVVNTSIVRKWPIIDVQVDLQNIFASIVEQVEQTKQKMRASLDEMDNHFNALIQRYFG